MEKILKDVVIAIKDAGKIILKYYNSEFEVKQKGIGNLVTQADIETDTFLKNSLTESYPQYGWLSEETRDSPKRLTKNRTWIVDPLDGTKEFVEGVPNFAISIGLVENGFPILGVILNPVTNDLYTAYKNGGTKFNGNPTFLCQNDNLIEMNILNSRSETKKGLWKLYKNEFKELIPLGSIALKLAMVSANQADFIGSLQPKNEWDICAGHCLINESGGELLTTQGKEITYNNPNTLITPGLVAGNTNAVKNFLNIL
jgi:myo-inositol-1(or 4)-monophosphatase